MTAKPSAGELADCDWPVDKPFTFYDEPGEHDPCYVVMPGGAMLPLNHHAGPGVDIARARFIVKACNAALRSSPQAGADTVREALEAAFKLNEFIAGAYILSRSDFRYLNQVSTEIRAALAASPDPAHDTA